MAEAVQGMGQTATGAFASLFERTTRTFRVHAAESVGLGLLGQLLAQSRGVGLRPQIRLHSACQRKTMNYLPIQVDIEDGVAM